MLKKHHQRRTSKKKTVHLMNNGNLGKTPSHSKSTLAISPAIRRIHPSSGSVQKPYNGSGSKNSNNNHNSSINTSGNAILNYSRPTTNLKTPSKNGLYTNNSRMRNFSNSSTQNSTGDGLLNPNIILQSYDSKKSDLKMSSAEKLRLWRHDALMQHQYKTAEFIGDKVYSITKDPNDAFWLAQVYFNQGFFIKALELLQKKKLDSTNIICQYLCGLCLYKLEKYEDALTLIGEKNPYKDQLESVNQLDLKKNTSESEKQNNYNEKNEKYTQNGDKKMVVDGSGESVVLDEEYVYNDDHDDDDDDETELEDAGIKLESSLCLLRGKIYLALNSLESAKECLKEACLVDVKNFESFQLLIDQYYLSPNEQIQFYNQLPFEQQVPSQDELELMKSLYSLKLSNYLNSSDETFEIYEKNEKYLKNEYGLSNNIDVLINEVDKLFIQCNFEKCLKLCEFVIENIEKYNLKILINYISCLYELSGKNKLFQISHDLVENCPKDAISWFSVATYHLATNKIGESRRYFSKSAVIDPNMLCSWIGFGHTYAAEGEHEQAILVYSTAARLFPGSHLPNLFLGMQYILLDSLNLAEDYFKLSYEVCSYDPLLLNEMGVVYYQQENYIKAKKYFKKACEMIVQLNSVKKSWVGIHVNLGHTYRKLDELEKALECFNLVLEVSKKDDNVYTSIGLILMKLNKLERAIDVLHKALVIQPYNQVAQDLLTKAMEINMQTAISESHPLSFNSLNPQTYQNSVSGEQWRKIEEHTIHVANNINNIHGHADLDVDSMDIE